MIPTKKDPIKLFPMGTNSCINTPDLITESGGGVPNSIVLYQKIKDDFFFWRKIEKLMVKEKKKRDIKKKRNKKEKKAPLCSSSIMLC